MRRTRWLLPVLAAELLVGALLRAAVALRAVSSLDRLFVPDDTYYTLTIARSLAHGHGPTTDGHTLTSGFQPLVAFLMVPALWLTDSADQALRIDIALLLLCDLAIVALLGYVAWRLVGPVAAAVTAGIWAVSPNAIRMAAGGLETSLAMLCEIALVAAWMWADDRPSTRRNIAVGVLAGLAVLARIDAVLLIGALVALALWRGPRRPLVTRAIAAAVTVAPWWGYCIVTFGSPIPASGNAARALQSGDAPFRPFLLSIVGSNALIGPFGAWTRFEGAAARHSVAWPFWLCLVGFVAAAAIAIIVARRDGAQRDWATAGALPLFGATLLVFYAWYNVSFFTYRYVAPAAMVVTLLVGCSVAITIERARQHGSKPIRAGVALALGVIGIALARPIVAGDRVALRAVSSPVPPHLDVDSSTGYRTQAMAMNRWVPDGALVGAEQTGALSYYATGGRTAVNLDGVVNPDAYRARNRGDLQQYIRDRRIHWFADNNLFLIRIALSLKRGRGPVVVHSRRALPVDRGSEPIFVVRVDYPDQR